MSSSSNATEFPVFWLKLWDPKNLTKKTSFAKQKTIVASILSKISQLLRLVLGNTTWWSYTWSEKQLGWWNWWYGFPICPVKKGESDSKLWHLFLNNFQTLGSKSNGFQGEIHTLATSTGSWNSQLLSKRCSQVLLGRCESHDFESAGEVQKILLEVVGKVWRNLNELNGWLVVELGDWARSWNCLKRFVGSMSHLPSWSSKSLTRKQQLTH